MLPSETEGDDHDITISFRSLIADIYSIQKGYDNIFYIQLYVHNGLPYSTNLWQTYSVKENTLNLITQQIRDSMSFSVFIQQKMACV